MLADATPAFGDVEHGRATPVAQHRPADEDRGPQRGGALEARLALLRGAGVLIEAEQVVGEANAQERALSGVEALHAEAVGLKIVFEFLDVLFAAGTLVVITPEFSSIALPVGDENPEDVTVHVDEPTPDGVFVFSDAFANGEELAGLRPALEFE